MKRTTKRYIITTSALNCYGYRVLTDGVVLTQFLKNPVLFWMHKMDTSPSPYDKTIPLGIALDVRKEGDEITCALGFSESNPFAMIIYGMYEDGSLNMLSLGAKPIELSTDAADLLPGQPGPTVTQCKATEISCCDIGGNDTALTCQLYDANDNIIALADLSPEAIIKLFNPLLKLSEANDEADVAKKVAEPNTTPYNHTHKTLSIIKNAIDAGKFTPQEAKELFAMGNDEVSLKKLHDKVKGAKINPLRLEGKIPDALMPLLSKNWSDLETSFGNGIGLLKEHAPDVYKAKFFEKNDRLPAERNGKPL